MSGLSCDMRLVHGGSIQKAISDLGDVFLQQTTEADLGKKKRKDIIALQSWIKTQFSPLVLCFFLADRDDNLGEGGAGRNTTAALTEAEKNVQLRATCIALLNRHVLPQVKAVIDSCDDASVLSQTLVRSLSNVRKDWTAFMISVKYLLMSLETESGRSGGQQVENVFKRTFQDTIFETFRAKLVDSLHNVVTMVRADPDKIGQQDCQNAQDLVRQFFDDVNTSGKEGEDADGGRGGGGRGGGGGGAGGASSAASTSGSEWAHSETKKLEDFHAAFVDPYKAKMSDQFREISNQYEMNNDLASLLSWIPAARRREMELIKSIFMNVYPADFEALANNILYEFDVQVASHNASRLVEHHEFGIEHILKKLPLEDPNVKWDANGADEATQPLMRRLRDLYSVSLTAQKAVATPSSARALPRTVTRNQRAVERRVHRENTSDGQTSPNPQSAAASGAAAAAAAVPAAPVLSDAPAYKFFLAAIKSHGSCAIREVIANVRTRIFRNPNDFASELVGTIGMLFRHKDSIYKQLCENSADVARAYRDAFHATINDESAKPSYLFSPSANATAQQAQTKTLSFAEVAAHYVDDYIRGKEQDIEAQADIAAELVSLFNDKDIFLDNHKHKTARRLLLQNFSEQVADRENSILSRLTFVQATLLRKAGPGMIEDLQAFVATQNAFEEQQQKVLTSSDPEARVAKINARIITGAFWPAYQQIPGEDSLQLPPSLVNCQRSFENFYRKRYPTKVLRWQHGRGTAVIDMAFPIGKKEVTMSVFQAIAIMCVDTEGSKVPGHGITLDQVAAKTNMAKPEVEKCLAGGLYMRGVPEPVLRFAETGGKKLSEGHAIELNPAFTLKLKKFNLMVASNAKDETNSSSIDDTMRQRFQLIDVAIVRIMKAQKEMKYADLVSRVVAQLERSFLCDPKWIKTRVSDLMERDFLERDEAEINTFRYKA